MAFIALFFWLLFKWLNKVTEHGKSVTVPDFKELKIENLDEFVADKSVRYSIVDSIYDVTNKKGIVVQQDPEPDSQVKENRTIYLTVTRRMPPHESMPKLVDLSMRLATARIINKGFKLGNIEYVPGFAGNVLQQKVKGKKIAPGTKILKGSVIDLEVGRGESDEKVPLPDLMGLTRKEALIKLAESSLSEGALIPEGEQLDTLNDIIYKQIPTPDEETMIPLGSPVDLYFRPK